MNAKDNQDAEFSRLLQAFHEAKERGAIKEAESIGVECLMFASEKAQKNPSESLRRVESAHEYENAGRWSHAESAFRQVVTLAHAEGNPALIFKAHSDLCNFLAIHGTPDNALQEAQSALAAVQGTDLPTLLLAALCDLFRCHMLKGDIISASATAEEAVNIVPAGKMFDFHRARALLMRARSRLEQGQVLLCGQDLDVAWRILEPQAQATMFAGVQTSLANWWEITAQLKTLAGDFGVAAQAMGKVVEFRRTVAHLPQLAGPAKDHLLAKSLQQYGIALLAAGEATAATGAFEESRKIQKITGIAVPSPGAI